MVVVDVVFISQLKNYGNRTTPLLSIHHLLRRHPHLHSFLPPPMLLQKHLLLIHHLHLLGGAIVDNRLIVTTGQSGRFEQGLDVYQGIGIGDTV